MQAANDRKDFRRQVFFSLGGIGIGLAAAGLIALFINNVIEPVMQVETQDLVKFSGETFSIWYHVDSPNMNSRHELLPRLDEALDDLITRLDVSIEEIPRPIDVLVHDSPEMMQQATLRRKSGSAMYSFYSVIDLIQDEDPYARLAELVLAFGWGRCSSQLLYKGMLMNVSFPERDFHIPLAAAPTRLLYSLEDMFMLEKANTYDETLYQRYQSPFSPRMARGSFEGIAEFRSMASSIVDEAADYNIADLQAASLVQYLIDCGGGLEEFRNVWGPGTTEAIMSRMLCGPLTELFEDWLDVVQDADTEGPDFAYYQARFLFEAGDIEAAADITESWDPSDLSSSESVLSVRTQLAAGQFETAALFASAADSSVSEVLEGWVDDYEGWRTVADGTFTVLGNGTNAALSETLREVQAAYNLVADTFNFRESELPEHITVFYYDTDEVRELGSSIIPVVRIHRAIWHISSQDSIVEEFIITLPSFVVKKETASNLLRRGITAMVMIDRDEMISRGCEMLQAGEWTPLWKLGFGGLPDHLFEIQTGLMMRYVVDTYGVDVVRDLWLATARIGGGMSLDTAFQSVLNASRTEIEESLINSVLNCE